MNHSPHAPRRIGPARRCLFWLAAALLPISAGWAATQYLYDDLGRLVLAVTSDGSATIYEHDANGNILAINQWGTTGPAIAAFSPLYGHAGTQITILGTNFSPTPGENGVTIGGVAATVSSATTSALVTTIPQGAVTGPITVTVSGVTATSTQNVTVFQPLISSFTPTVVAPGGAVTVTGGNLNLVPGSTSMKVANTAVTISSLNNTQAVIVAPSSGSGRITVNTSYGQAVSAGTLLVVPTAVGAANVVANAALQVNGAAQSLTINQQNKYGLLYFDATAGQYLSVQVDSFSTTPSGSGVAYYVYAPNGTLITSGSVNSTNVSVHLPTIATTGTYLLAFGSGGSSSAQVTARIEVNSTLSPGTAVNASTPAARQGKRFVFNATAGDDFGFALTGLSLTPASPNYVYVEAFQPNGNNIASFYCYTTSNPGCPASLLNVAQTGTYSVRITPMGASTMSFSVLLSQDVTGTLAAGTPSTVNLSLPGQLGLLTFSATAGQTVALHMGSIATTPSGKTVTMYVYAPNGSQITSVSNATQGTLNLTNLVAGTHSVLIAPSDAATGSAQVTLANGLTGVLPIDGTSQSFSSTVPRQNGYFTFSATAGDDLAIALTGLSLTPSSPNYVYVEAFQPNGNYVAGFYCYTTSSPGCSASMINVAQTGIYSVRVTPQGPSTMSFSLTLSQDVTGTLSTGTPLSVSLPEPGRQALLTFSASAGQTVALHMGSIATTPSGKAVTMYVYAPNGSQIGSVSNATQGTLNLTNLAAGTHSVLIAPSDAATGSAQVTLANGLTGVLPTDGTSQSFSSTVPRQNGYFTFSATAGDDLGIALTGLSLTPASPNYVYVEAFQPNGNNIASFYCYTTSSPGCSASLFNVAQTGTYSVRVTPQGAQTMSFSLTISQDVTGTITAGTPSTVNLSLPGQVGLLTFSATAGQTVALHMGSIATTPSGKTVTMYVYAPNGSQITSVSNATQGTLNLTNLVAGTHSVLIAPSDAATGSAQVTLANGLTGVLPIDGTSQSFSSTVPRQNGYFTFSATAGDDLGIAMTNLSLTPGSPTNVYVDVYQPNGNYVTAFWCYTTSNPGCSSSMVNVAQTGTYKVTVTPQAAQTMSFSLTISQDVTGTLSAGTPSSVTLPVAGQNALLTFTATAGQSASLAMSSISTTPSGKSVTMSAFNPSGAQIASVANTNTMNLTNLVAGTYSILIAPADGATASLQVLRQ